jgi:hypothetical protein
MATDIDITDLGEAREALIRIIGEVDDLGESLTKNASGLTLFAMGAALGFLKRAKEAIDYDIDERRTS